MADEARSNVIVDGDSSGARGAISGVSSSFGSLFGTIAGGVTAGNLLSKSITNIIQGFKGAIGGAIDMNASLETTTLQFGTLMGDSDKAKAHVLDLFEFAKKTPFETKPIIEASKHMQVFGGAALNTKDNLTLLGNASAATNAPINELGFWVGRLYSQLQAGKPFGESAMRLQELAVMTPQVRTQMEGLQKAGGSAADVFKIFQTDLQRFNGAMEKQAGTWSGLMSTLSDVFNMTGAQILKPFFELAKDGLNDLVELFGSKGFESAVESAASTLESSLHSAIDFFKPSVTALAHEFFKSDGLIPALWELGKTTWAAGIEATSSVTQELATLMGALGIEQEKTFTEQMIDRIRSTTAEVKIITGWIKALSDQAKTSVSIFEAWGNFFDRMTEAGNRVSGQTAATKKAQDSFKGLEGQLAKTTSAADALALMNSGKLHDGIGVVTGDTYKFAESNAKAEKAAAKQKEALDDIHKSLVPLTAAQQRQVTEWDKSNVSAAKMAQALGISADAVQNFIKNQEILTKEIKETNIASVDWGKTLGEGQVKAGLTQARGDIIAVTGTLDQFKARFKGEMFPDWTASINDIGKALRSSMILPIKETLPMMVKLKDVARSSIGGLNDIFQKAFEGGGGVGGAIKSFATNAAAGIMNMVPVIGPVLGQFAGAIVGGFSKIFGSLFGTAGRDAVREFAASMGGFDEIHAKLAALGDAGEQLWIKLTQGVGRNNAEQAKAAIADVTNALEAHKNAVAEAQAAHDGIIGKLAELTAIAPGLQAALDTALEAKTPQDYLAALSRVGAEIEKQNNQQKELDATLKKYGLSWDEVGGKARAARLAETASGIAKEFDLLVGAGVNVNHVLEKMGPSINDFVRDARKSGAEVPESFKRIIQHAIDAGQIFDDDKKKISDMSGTGVTFGTTMVEVTQNVATQIQRLGDIIERLNGGFGNTASTADKAGRVIAASMRTAKESIDDAKESLDGFEYGHSPGGQKDLPILQNAATASFIKFGRESGHVLDATKAKVDATAKKITGLKAPAWAKGEAADEFKDLSRDIALLEAPNDDAREALRLKFQKQDEVQALTEQKKALGSAFGPLMDMIDRKYSLMVNQMRSEQADRMAEELSRQQEKAQQTIVVESHVEIDEREIGFASVRTTPSVLKELGLAQQ